MRAERQTYFLNLLEAERRRAAAVTLGGSTPRGI